MSKLPYMQFYPADWMQDTRCLSLAAKGAWMDCICEMWRLQIGTLNMPVTGYARLFGSSVDQAESVIGEIEAYKVADITKSGNTVTTSCRRIVRFCNANVQNAERVAKHRDRTKKESLDHGVSEGCNDIVMVQSLESRNQKLETKEEKTVTIPDSLNRSPEFKVAWLDWIGYRRKNGGKVKDFNDLFTRQLRLCEGWGLEGAIQSLNDSMNNGWTGLFAPKNTKPKQQQIKMRSQVADPSELEVRA